jgi:hypothetical protein
MLHSAYCVKKPAVIVFTETSYNHADTSKDSGIYLHHIL